VKPVVAISMGDPGGVGAEVILKALVRPEVMQALTPMVVGDEKQLAETAQRLNLPYDLERLNLDALESARKSWSGVLIQPYQVSGGFSLGQVFAENGAASYAYIETAARAVLDGHADALCTAPISKEAIKMAGFDFPGHTEMLAHFCGRNDVRMMLVGGGLRVVLQTIHVALKDVPGLLTVERILQSLRMINEFAAAAGERAPRIGVCGLNPHAGEAGHFGREEIDVISPAVEMARSEEIDVSEPLPGDTIFHRMLEGDFDYVLAMYHDQALIPVKTLDFHGGVNVTVGLPLIRTSPDHGTAFGLAGRGVANESSMVAALLYAAELVEKRRRISL